MSLIDRRLWHPLTWNYVPADPGVWLFALKFDLYENQISKPEEPQMIKKNSIYSLNKKNPDAIVYPSATGKPVFVTREDFPSEEEFLAFKK